MPVMMQIGSYCFQREGVTARQCGKRSRKRRASDFRMAAIASRTFELYNHNLEVQT